MSIDDVKTPKELMEFLNKNIKYGVIDRKGNRLYDSSKQEFQNACKTVWKTRSVFQILKEGIGHCYDIVEIERFWFEKNGYIAKTIWISAYQQDIENSGFAHTYLLFKENEKWNLFEFADYKNKGIYEFNSVDEAIEWQKNKQIEFAKSYVKPVEKYDVAIYEYEKPKIGLTMNGFLTYIENCKKIDV